jgi:hypothetical protein
MVAMTKVEGMTIYVGPPQPGNLQPAQALTPEERKEAVRLFVVKVEKVRGMEV